MTKNMVIATAAKTNIPNKKGLVYILDYSLFSANAYYMYITVTNYVISSIKL